MDDSSINIKANNLFIKRLLWAWALLTLILILVSGTMIFGFEINKKSFFILINILNIILFSPVFLFQKKINLILIKSIDESRNLSIDLDCKHDRIIRLFMFSVFIFFSMIFIFFSVYDTAVYFYFIYEDGIVEYLSAIYWFLGAVVLFSSILKLLKEGIKNNYELFFCILLMIFFIVCGGEEISWGQRIFGLKTPELLDEINLQHEINFHNIGSISVFSNVFFCFTVIYFLIVPYLMKKNLQISNIINYLHFPIPNKYVSYIYAASLIVWIFIGVRFGTLGFHPFSFYPEHYYSQMDDEAFEFFAAYSFLCFSIFHSVSKYVLVKK